MTARRYRCPGSRSSRQNVECAAATDGCAVARAAEDVLGPPTDDRAADRSAGGNRVAAAAQDYRPRSEAAGFDLQKSAGADRRAERHTGLNIENTAQLNDRVVRRAAGDRRARVLDHAGNGDRT